MDYGKISVNKKLHKLKTRGSRFSTKAAMSALRLFLVAIVCLAIIVGFAGFGMINGLIASAPSLDGVNVVPEGYVTKFYYNDGTISQTLVGAGGNREYITIDKIPKHVQNAFIAIEDERFWDHDGIDVRSIFRAASEALRDRELGSGGSTLTQQLLKNQVFGGGNENAKISKIIRKIQEQYLAIQLEHTMSKETILEYYLNTINLGQGAYGIQMAAQTYFGKDVSELTVSEAAVLACLPQSPTRMNPYRNPEDNVKRRSEVLDEMLDNGFITEQEFFEAKSDTENVYSNIRTVIDARTQGSEYYSYFTDQVITELMKDLQALGYSSSQASNLIYTGGLSVMTTQDKDIQAIANDVLLNEANYPALGDGSYYSISYALSVQKADGKTIHYQLSDFVKYFNNFKGHEKQAISRIYGGLYNLMVTDLDYITECTEEFYNTHVEEGDTLLGVRFTKTLEPQVSFSMMEQSTGAVVCLVGGRGEKEGNRTFNRATDSLRQVGSTFKVLAAYLPAIDTGTITLAEPINDEPHFYPGTTKMVNNWWKKTPQYMGIQNPRLGISYSMNVLAVKTIEKVTPEVAYVYLKKLGFTTLVERMVAEDGQVFSDIGPALALGGLTNGVTNVEVNAGFAAIANNGVYNSPIYYTKVYDHNGNVLINKKSTKTQVMKTSTAFLLTSAMEDTVKPGVGTAGGAAFHNYKMPVACKSGTTTGDVDLWLCGFTPYYTASIWEGFDVNYSVSKSVHISLWRQIMERAHELKQLPYKEFSMPDSITTAVICSKSGKLAVPGLCDQYAGGSTVRTEYFTKGTAPLTECDCHKKVLICTETGLLASPDCKNTMEQILLVKEEPEYWEPIDDDLSLDPPTLPTEEEIEELLLEHTQEEVDAMIQEIIDNKPKVEYATSDTNYLLPTETCTECSDPLQALLKELYGNQDNEGE